jgi:hypothetical protein
MIRAACSPRVSEATRQRVQCALERLPGRGRSSALDYREHVFASVQDVARAWGGTYLSASYEGHRVPLEFECAAGHRFQMRIQGLRHGHWCRICAHDRARAYSIEDAQAVATNNGGRCLSTHYQNSLDRLHWRCSAGHTWLASLADVRRGYWCRACHFESIKPQQERITRAAVERGGRCLSTYVNGETPLEWECAAGHRWFAPWFRVRRGQWCRRCAAKSRTRTIEQLHELAKSRGGQCMSTVYRGAHDKIEWACSKQHVWRATVNSVWRGSWCPECARAARSRDARAFSS